MATLVISKGVDRFYISIMDVELRFNITQSDEAVITLPGSKSISLRALVLANVFTDEVMLNGLSDSDDCLDLRRAFQTFKVEGADRRLYSFGYGAAPLRFFLAFAASCPGFRGTLQCMPELQRRPIKPLIEALRSAGAKIDCLGGDETFPLYVEGRKLSFVGDRVAPEISSQFASALLMASLLWDQEYVVRKSSGAVSFPYVEMTKKMIGQFRKIHHEATDDTPVIYKIEKDWSAASYFYELALLLPDVKIRLTGMSDPAKSLQGDSRCAEIFRTLGVDTTFDSNGDALLSCSMNRLVQLKSAEFPLVLNMADTPDLVPALTVALCMAGIKFRIEQIGHLRHKESDRIEALAQELIKCGYIPETGADSIAWSGNTIHPETPFIINSHGDHRIAMAFAAAAIKFKSVIISGAECVSKSFPDFFGQLRKIGIDTLSKN